MNALHHAFNCLVCHKALGNFTNEANVGDEIVEGAEYEIESYAICDWCGAAYLVSKSREIQSAEVLARLNPRWTWKIVPDALLPKEIRDVQAYVRATTFMNKGGNA